MCFLAVSAAPRAVHTLLRAHEAVLAYAVAESLGQPKDSMTLKLLAQSAERDQRWDIAAHLWGQHPKGPSLHLPLLAVRCTDPEAVQAWHPFTPTQHQEQLNAALAAGD